MWYEGTHVILNSKLEHSIEYNFISEKYNRTPQLIKQHFIALVGMHTFGDYN